jgi:L-ascorbate metabolism protein UlaG (beta-lactamase superfamily)
VTIVLAVVLLRLGFDSVGGEPSGKLLERIKHSPNYDGTEFVNLEATRNLAHGGFWSAVRGLVFAEDDRRPAGPLPSVPEPLSTFTAGPGPLVCWLGHSTVLVRIDSTTLLIDPVLDEYVSLQVGRTRRFQSPTLSREGLPPIDAVLISHDHFDHLEMSTVQYLASKGTLFIVPLGIGAHLTAWGVHDSQIVDLDWWESTRLGDLGLACTPARHLSGRTIRRMNKTLWCSWAVIGPKHRLYYGGDTGYSRAFKEIGERYGPFDLTVMPIGAYGEEWPDIHLTPEQAVKAHLDLNGMRLLPVHWGTFNVALHPWDEPIERLVAARKSQVEIVAPRLGEVVDVDRATAVDYWWERVE